MKKTMLMAAAVACISLPASANMHDAEMKMMTEHCVKKADTSKDGLVDKAEWDAYGDMMFKDSDTSGDGKVSAEEMMANQKKHMDMVKGEMKDH